MEISNKLLKILFIILASIFISQHSISLENKIVFKINNKIITTVDIQNEINYLKTLNPGLKNLDENEIYRISKKSIVNEKIKIIEISKYFKNVEIPLEYLETLSKNVYRKIGISNEDDFKKYLNYNNIKYTDVLEKIKIEAQWNELIYSKYSKKINIDTSNLKEKVEKNIMESSKSYLMSEILFQVDKAENIQSKYQEIKKMILEKGFENAALKYSASSTANIGGKLDWIASNSLNKNIVDAISTTKKNKFTKPILIPGGFIILKINDIKTINKRKNVKEELDKLISSIRNSQLNQFSIIHFNKIKQDIEINEI